MRFMKYSLSLLLAAALASATEVRTIAIAQNPYGLMIGPDGGLYICEIDNHQVTRLDLKTGVRTAILSGQQPYEVRFDHAGNLFMDDMPGHVIVRLDYKTKAVDVIAGTANPGFSGDGGPAVQAQFKQPHSIAFDRDGNLLVCDIGNKRIRRINLKTGIIDEFDAGMPLNGPRAIAFDNAGNMFIVLREGNAIYRIDAATHKTARFAGTGEKGYTGDGGPALDAKFNGPKGISCAPDGSLYVADTENHVIRRVDKNGVITTVLGTGHRGDGPDGDPLHCSLSRPHGIFVASDGVVYVGDSESNKIRVVR
jgi:DNA-binding beta-propeller fold protein YncE